METLRLVNLGLRFLLELAGLFAMGYWGFVVMESAILKWIVGIGLPLAFAIVWAVFRIPNDGGSPIVTVGGQMRLLIEVTFFAAAIGGLFHAGRGGWATVLLVLVLGHYALDYQRTLDLLLGRR